MNYIGYLYAIIASILVGLHIFTFKYIEKYEKYYYLIFLSLSVLLWICSRYFLYKSNKSVDVVLVHLFLTCSIFVTLLLSIIIYKANYDLIRMITGIILAIFGIYLVDSSIKPKN